MGSALLQKYPKILVQAVYLGIHLVFIVAIVSACAYNGSNFYAKLLQPLYYMSVVQAVEAQAGIRLDNVPEAHQGPSRAFYSASMGVQRVVSSVVKKHKKGN